MTVLHQPRYGLATPASGTGRTTPSSRLTAALRARGDGAFTLLETVIALGILSVGVLAVAASLLTALKYSTDSRGMTQAMYLADEQLEIMRAMSGTDVLALMTDPAYPDDPANPIDPDPGDDDPTQFNRRWTIQPNTPENGVITITVEVDYVDTLGIQRTVTLRSLKSEI